MKFADLKEFVSTQLVVLDRVFYAKLPTITYGPSSDQNMQKLSPGPMIFMTIGGGAGLETEQLFDKPFITTRVVSEQGDYEGGEKMAADLDTIFLKVCGNAKVGNAKVLYITRTGGAPMLLEKDSGDRYHFTGSYIVNTQTGL